MPQRMARFWSGLPVTALAVLVATASISAYLEFRPFLVQAQGNQERFRNLETGRAGVGISSYSARFVLDDCLNAMTSLYGRLQGEDRRLAVSSQCARLSRLILARTPTDSYAYAVAALASRASGDPVAFETQFKLSHVFGPNELWVAELRFELFEDGLENLAAPLRDLADRDMQLLFTSGRGRSAIIGRYVTTPASRERITGMVENMPADIRDAFLLELQNQLGQRRNETSQGLAAWTRS